MLEILGMIIFKTSILEQSSIKDTQGLLIIFKKSNDCNIVRCFNPFATVWFIRPTDLLASTTQCNVYLQLFIITPSIFQLHAVVRIACRVSML